MAFDTKSLQSNLSAVSEARTEMQKGLKAFRAFEGADKALSILENIEQVIAERVTVAETIILDAKAQATEMMQDAFARREAVSALKQEAAQAQEQIAQADVELKAKRAEVEILTEQLAEARATIDRAERLRSALSVA